MSSNYYAGEYDKYEYPDDKDTDFKKKRIQRKLDSKEQHQKNKQKQSPIAVTQNTEKEIIIETYLTQDSALYGIRNLKRGDKLEKLKNQYPNRDIILIPKKNHFVLAAVQK